MAQHSKDHEEEEDGLIITPFRGATGTFITSLLTEYQAGALIKIAHLLKKSSALNIGRTPFQIGQKSIGLVVDSVGLIFNEGVNIASHLTLDDEYVAQQKKQRAQKKKEIDGVAAGAGEALKSVGEGVVGLFDVFTKPVEGARDGGVGGFFKGVGVGIMGTIVKPITKVGEAVSDLGSGLSAEVKEGTIVGGITKHRMLKRRKRLPRFLSGELGSISIYNPLEARVQEYLSVFCRHCQLMLPLFREEASKGGRATAERANAPGPEDILVAAGLAPDDPIVLERKKPALYVLLCASNLLSLVRVPMIKKHGGDRDANLEAEEENLVGAVGGAAANILGQVFLFSQSHPISTHLFHRISVDASLTYLPRISVMIATYATV